MKQLSPSQRLVATLVLSSVVSILLSIARALFHHSGRYWFLNFNLMLAWLPLGFAWLLYNYVRKNAWTSWQGVALTLLWLGFLPNSFYIVSDLVHLQADTSTPIYDLVLLMSFAWNGLLLGFFSVYLVHMRLLKRLERDYAHILVGGVLLLSSFAIYLGRYLRFSTWDVLFNPAALIFDLSDRVINPIAHEQTFRTTALFFVLLGSMYFVVWQFVQAIRDSKAG